MIMNASAIVVYVAVALASFPGWPRVSPFTPRGECFQTLDRQADDAPGVTLKEGESFDFRFEGLDYQRKQSILPQVVVYFGKGVGQIEEGRHFAYRLFSDDFTEEPFSAGTDPIVSRSMVSSAHGNAWQDLQGVIRLTVTSGTITVASLRITVYTGSDVYESTFRLAPATPVSDGLCLSAATAGQS